MAETKRVRRTPINGTRNKLSVVGKDADYEYRHVLDVDGRIQELQENGWQLVAKKDHKVGDDRVAEATPIGSHQHIVNKNGDVQYLMRIKKEYYDEDQKAKLAKVDSDEESMHNDSKYEGLTGNIKISRK